jgi:16S rRNA (cytidine1402-2'-O)-methyltransferase
MADLQRTIDILADADVAILSDGWLPYPSGIASELIRAAIQRGFPVVPVPGPSLAITSLILSGLPADAFVYLGQLPAESAACRDLLGRVAGERQTLIAQVSPAHLCEALIEFRRALGDRSLVVVTAAGQGVEAIWRGTLGEVSGRALTEVVQESCVLVVGGTRGRVARWEEPQLRAQVRACLEQGLGAKEISRQLAPQSGWPRREIYRLAVETAQAISRMGKGL